MLQRTKQPQAWRNFSGAVWQREIDVRDFIVSNVTPYDGGPEFLAKPTSATLAVWEKLQPYFREEAKKGVLDVDANDAVVADFARAGLHRPRQRGDRRPADRQAVPPRDHAHGRLGHGRERPQGDRPRA